MSVNPQSTFHISSSISDSSISDSSIDSNVFCVADFKRNYPTPVIGVPLVEMGHRLLNRLLQRHLPMCPSVLLPNDLSVRNVKENVHLNCRFKQFSNLMLNCLRVRTIPKSKPIKGAKALLNPLKYLCLYLS